MPKANVDLLAFNRGLVSPKALARVDVERTRLSAAVMTNWLPKTQGAMTIRPGTKYLGSSKSDNAANFLEFIAAINHTALPELTADVMRVWDPDDGEGALITRPTVTTSISNGSFATSTDWLDNSSGGGAPTYSSSGLTLNATNVGGLCRVKRQITVAAADRNIEHGLAINVTRGPVTFRVGSTSGGEEYVSETELKTGRHSLAFTPTGDFHLTFQSDKDIDKIVASIAVEASGAMELTAPWAAGDIPYVLTDQSADVIFATATGIQPRRIERRGTGRSWSVVTLAPDNGPFLPGRTSRVMMKPAATFGNTTLTTDQPFFSSSHAGALFRIFHIGQGGVWQLGRADTVTDAIEMTGIGRSAANAERRIVVVTTGTWTATITVQRSFDGPDEGFHDAVAASSGATTITTNATTNIDDIDDNITVWYRLKIKSGNYTSGTAICTITYANGGKTGTCRVTGYTSPTQVSVEVLSRFSDTIYSDNWNEGAWSAEQGYPDAVQLHEGRLWLSGQANVWASVSDDYENFDDETEGDSAPLSRSLGKGPVDVINWMMSGSRLLIGTASQELAVRSSSLDEVITVTNSSVKGISTQGSAPIRALPLDTKAIFVNRSAKRIFMLVYDPNTGEYAPADLTKLVPDLLSEGVVAIAVQRQPDTRIHVVLGDGTVALLTYDEVEEVLCWSKWETLSGDEVEWAAVLPTESGEDRVYYHIKRTINGATKRYLEKWALESECVGGTRTWLVDCGVEFTGPSTAVSGLTHLEAEAVIMWADGADKSPDTAQVQATYTVASGAFTANETITAAVVGLPYDADHQSTKMAYAAALGTALTQKKRMNAVGFILYKTWATNGLYFGGDESHLDPMPLVVAGATVTANQIHETLDIEAIPFPGDWSTDSRLWLKARAPRPCTILAAVPSLMTHDTG